MSSRSFVLTLLVAFSTLVAAHARQLPPMEQLPPATNVLLVQTEPASASVVIRDEASRVVDRGQSRGGRFRSKALPVGKRYSVEVSADGYRTLRVDAYIKAGSIETTVRARLTVTSIGGSTPEPGGGQAWADCLRDPKPECYYSFIQTYPRSAHASEAAARLRALEEPYWNSIIASWEPYDFHTYLLIYSSRGLQGRYATTAKVMLARLDSEYWNKISLSNDPRDFDRYVEIYDDASNGVEGQFVKMARERREQLSTGRATVPERGLAEGKALTGRIRMIGSETIGERVGVSWANDFNSKNPGITVTVKSTGSTEGFKALNAGECDIATASRPPTKEEIERAKAAGIDLDNPDNEIVVGLDGIGVLVSQQNPLAKLTREQLKSIFTGEVSNWSSITGRDAAIRLIIPSTKHGTHGLFKDKVLDGKSFPAAAEQRDDSARIGAEVNADANAIGFVTFTQIGPSKLVKIAAFSGAEALLPTEDTIRDQKYFLARKLYLYTRTPPQGAIKEFIDYVLDENQGQTFVKDNEFVALTGPLRNILTAKTGSEHFRDLHFRFGSSQIDGVGKQAINQIVREVCPKSDSLELVLTGYTDNVGSSTSNEALSLKRAESVRVILSDRCQSLKIATLGRGEESPIADNRTEEGRQLNRRVEVAIRVIAR